MLIKLPYASTISVLLCLISLVLTSLCVFAGSSKGFLDDYAILTLNTSQINLSPSHHLLTDTRLAREFKPLSSLAKAAPTGDEPRLPQNTGETPFSRVAGNLRSKFTRATQTAVQPIKTQWEHNVDDLEGSVAKALGVHDFYAVHLLNLCQGDFVAPSESDVSSGVITTNVTSCSRPSVKHVFDPLIAVQPRLGSDGLTLKDLNWPEEFNTKLDTLQALQQAVLAFYLLSIAFMLIALTVTVVSTSCMSLATSFPIFLIECAAVIVLGVAAVTVTVLAMKGAALINAFGSAIGISATAGLGFLGLTWLAWVAILIAASI